MDPALVRQLAIGAVPPLVAGALVFAAAFGRRAGQAPAQSLGVQGTRAVSGWRATLLVVACAVVPVLMHRLVWNAWPKWPPVGSDQALFYVAVIAALVGLASWLVLDVAGAGRRWALAIVVPLVLVGLVGAGFLSARNLIANRWGTEGTLRHAAVFLPAAVAFVAGLVLLVRTPGPGSVGSVALLATVLSQTIAAGLSGLALGQSAGVVASFLGAGAVVALFRPAVAIPIAAALGLGVLLATIGLHGVLFGIGDNRAWMMLAFVLAPWLAWLPTRVTRWQRWKLWIAQLALALLPLGVAIALAVRNVLRQQEYGY